MRFKVFVLLISSVVCQGAFSQDSTQPARTQPPPDPHAGQLIQWEGWSFRWQYRDIEGLMLTDVHFRAHKVLKAINLAEIYVPYATGLPRPEDFALGGFLANPLPLEIGRDCVSAGTQCRAFNRDHLNWNAQEHAKKVSFDRGVSRTRSR